MTDYCALPTPVPATAVTPHIDPCGSQHQGCHCLCAWAHTGNHRCKHHTWGDPKRGVPTTDNMMARGTEKMAAADVLTALRRWHPRAAIVPELGIVDEWAYYDFDDALAAGALPEQFPVYTRRVDALMFEARVRTAIEIKVTRADAKRESPNKVRPWRRCVHRYVYACPAGLLDAPPVYGCGLWWVHPGGRVEVRQRTKTNTTPEPLPQSVIQNLAYRAASMPIVDAEVVDDVSH